MPNILSPILDIQKMKSEEYIQMCCPQCNTLFVKIKKEYTRCIKNNKEHTFYCAASCFQKTKDKRQFVPCNHCNKNFQKGSWEIQNTNKNFCSRSCLGFYFNEHKTSGINRSKLELKLEENLLKDYPNIGFEFCNTSILNGLELDIYIPTLKLAFEIQGIFHYEPIFGQEKLEQIQERDIRKKILAQDASINLIEINISKYKYITDVRFNAIYSLIKSYINQ